MPDYSARVDVREITPHENKYPAVKKTFDSLKPGEKMELINDHDPAPLFTYKLPFDFPDQFEWKYLEQGPEVWRVEVTKTK